MAVCDSDGCAICHGFGQKIQTPADMRDTILWLMDHPVEDKNNRGHFVPPNKMMAVIINNKMTLDMLKKELPKLDKHRFETDIAKKNAAADSEAG
eukprot:116961-Ditylum_brightwellii.AAC.1